MPDNSDSINHKSRITLSRNRTIALLVGVAGFLGSHLAEKLLERGIQVIGIDDFSTGIRKNLSEVIKNKDFHLINGSIDDDFFSIPENIKDFGISRLDYAFFTAESERADLYSRGVTNFVNFCRQIRDQQVLAAKGEKGEVLSKKQIDLDPSLVASEKPRIVFVSSVNLYASKLDRFNQHLKDAEIRFAKMVSYYKLNARVVRLAPIYGPKMPFRESDPMIRLIQSALLDKIQDETTSLDFSTRSIFVKDAVNLLIKAALSGSTAEKIYDGALLHPINASDIRQVLLDPLWAQRRGVHLSQLPEWPTPNLKRTIKELGWKPQISLIDSLRETIAYFKDHDLVVPEIQDEALSSNFQNEIKKEMKRWSFASIKEEDEQEKGSDKNQDGEEDFFEGKQGTLSRIMQKILPVFLILIVFFGLIYPTATLIIGGLSIRSNLQSSKDLVEKAEFDKAKVSLNSAHNNLKSIKQLTNSLAVLQRIGVFNEEIGNLSQLINLTEEGIEGSKYALSGSQNLYEATKIISGESTETDPKKLYQDAQVNLTYANEKLTKVQARLEDDKFINKFHPEIRSRALDFAQKLKTYSALVEKGRVLSVLIPSITGVEGEKNYILLVSDNLELRPSGGVITSIASLTFKDGKLTSFKIEDSNNIDSRLKDLIPVSPETASDLKVDRLFLKDSSIDPDFPTSARLAEYIYKRIENKGISGVIAVNLNTLSGLIKAVGGVEIAEISQKISGDDLILKYLDFKRSQLSTPSKRNYLTLVSEQLFNKIFFVKAKNWPEVINQSSNSLGKKDMLIYLSEPQSLSLLASENWAGILPQGVNNKEGEYSDFLAVTDINLALAPLNYFIQKTIDLKTTISTEDKLTRQLTIRIKNSAPNDSLNNGVYKNRIKVYLPLGVNLVKAELGGVDITKEISSYSDHNRQVFSTLLELSPSQESLLFVEYATDKLEFKNDNLTYRLDVFKQPGSGEVPLNINFIYPQTLKAKTESLDVVPSEKEGVSLSNRPSEDKSFVFEFQKTP